jgi:dihydrofolate reductase
MGKLNAFTFVTLNGYFEASPGDISWHKHGGEEAQFSAESLNSGHTLLFGRVTYEMMASYWPASMAVQNDPVVAGGMNAAEKVVFSRTLENAAWSNTRVVKENIIDEVKRLKQQAKNMTLLGSGSIVTQLAEEGLIDTYQIMIDPVALGNGSSLFKGMKGKLDLQLIDSRTFKSGVVLLHYHSVNS